MNIFSSDSIIPSAIHDISYLGREQTSEVINACSTGLQSSNSDLTQIFDSNSTFGTLGSFTLDGFYLSDGVWNEKQYNDLLFSADNATDTTAVSDTTTPRDVEPNVNTNGKGSQSQKILAFL
jgi:hypothetical protein